jgi:hypothetical protein
MLVINGGMVAEILCLGGQGEREEAEQAQARPGQPAG